MPETMKSAVSCYCSRHLWSWGERAASANARPLLGRPTAVQRLPGHQCLQFCTPTCPKVFSLACLYTCCTHIAWYCHFHLSEAPIDATWEEARMGHSACLLPAFTAPGEAGDPSLSSTDNTAFSSLLTPAFATAMAPAACYGCMQAMSAGAEPVSTP